MSARLLTRRMPQPLSLVSRNKSKCCYSTTSTEPLIVQKDIPAPNSGSIRILALNNPKTRNAISRALLADLGRHVKQIAEEGTQGPTRALILASNVDASFCAGADLKERQTFTVGETQDFLKTLRGTFAELSRLPVPTIAALSSLALGGGLELALTTHFRVFATTATVALPESRLAIIPGAGGTYRLPALIGRTRALDMMLTGRRVAGAEAYFLGIADRLVPVDPAIIAEAEKQEAESNSSSKSDEEKRKEAKEREARILAVARQNVLDGAVGLAREICEGGPLAVRQLIDTVAGPAIQEEWRVGEARENAAYDAIIPTKDRTEALMAFKEKRKPMFKGH